MAAEKKTPTPALDQMRTARKELGTQHIGSFLEWLGEHGMAVCGCERDEWYPVPYSVEQLLARYAGVDLAAVEQERRAILDALRANQPTVPAPPASAPAPEPPTPEAAPDPDADLVQKGEPIGWTCVPCGASYKAKRQALACAKADRKRAALEAAEAAERLTAEEQAAREGLTVRLGALTAHQAVARDEALAFVLELLKAEARKQGGDMIDLGVPRRDRTEEDEREGRAVPTLWTPAEILALLEVLPFDGIDRWWVRDFSRELNSRPATCDRFEGALQEARHRSRQIGEARRRRKRTSYSPDDFPIVHILASVTVAAVRYGGNR
ncbi:MAG TPA: hypothetical protein VEA38_25825 [Terriglobales bacterium]|nr:hypothetical protein [Terriglobales bacterium]